MRIRAVLQRAVSTMHVLFVRRGAWQLCALQAFFNGGTVRSYLLGYRPAGNNRPRRVWCRSMAELPGRDDLDLRRREDAQALALVLQDLDLTTLD